MNDLWTLSGKKALITGATRGIGKAIAEEFLNLGADVCIAARNENDLQERLSEWKQKNQNVIGIALDVSTAEGREKLLLFINDQWNHLDILVNNVGTNIRKKVVEFSPEEYASLQKTNVVSTFEMCRIFYPLLKKSGDASIVNMGSTAGLTALRTGAPYAMTKAAIHQLTKNLSYEWAQDGIRVNAVAPWYIRTPLVDSLLKDESYLKDILDRTPMKRIGEPIEVASVIAFMCMPAASYVTGQVVAIDGGFSIYGF